MLLVSPFCAAIAKEQSRNSGHRAANQVVRLSRVNERWALGTGRFRVNPGKVPLLAVNPLYPQAKRRRARPNSSYELSRRSKLRPATPGSRLTRNAACNSKKRGSTELWNSRNTEIPDDPPCSKNRPRHQWDPTSGRPYKENSNARTNSNTAPSRTWRSNWM